MKSKMVARRGSVLVAAVDLSEASASVFDAALEIAHDAPDAHIHLVHVAGARAKSKRENALEALAAWAEKLPEHAAHVDIQALHGDDAAALIVEYAAKIDADAILVGTHGRAGMARILVGSVAETIVRTAGCSVFVVRKKAHEDR